MTTGGVTTILTKVGPVVGVTAKGWKGRSLNLIDTFNRIIPLEVQPTTIDEVWVIPQKIIQVIVVISFEFIYLDLKKPTLMLCFKKKCHLNRVSFDTKHFGPFYFPPLEPQIPTIGLSQVQGFFIRSANVGIFLLDWCENCDACNKVTFLWLLGWNSRVPVDRAGTRLGQSMMWWIVISPHVVWMDYPPQKRAYPTIGKRKAETSSRVFW